MIEKLLAGAIVAVALFFTGRSLWRGLHGGDSKCGGCSGCGADSMSGESPESQDAGPRAS